MQFFDAIDLSKFENKIRKIRIRGSSTSMLGMVFFDENSEKLIEIGDKLNSASDKIIELEEGEMIAGVRGKTNNAYNTSVVHLVFLVCAV